MLSISRSIRNAIASAVSSVSVLYYIIAAGRQELSVVRPKKFISDWARIFCLNIFCAVVDINHSSPALSHLPKFSPPPMHLHSRPRVLHIPHERKLLVLNITLVLAFSFIACALMLFVIRLSFIIPQMCLTCGGLFLVDWLQDGMILISLRRFNLPIKRDHFISDMLWSFPPLAVFMMCLCLLRPLCIRTSQIIWTHFGGIIIEEDLWPLFFFQISPHPPLSLVSF